MATVLKYLALDKVQRFVKIIWENGGIIRSSVKLFRFAFFVQAYFICIKTFIAYVSDKML